MIFAHFDEFSCITPYEKFIKLVFQLLNNK